ncbi:MAG: C-terminal binding protein [Clostridia bacterium]|nr:C-terminal binding protein [Clostridia bacterium]
MKKAVVVDKNYGSVSLDKLNTLRIEFAKNDIDLALEHFTSQEEIIEGCADAQAILGTGNPPITAKVINSLGRLELVQRFGIGVNSIDLKAATDAGVLAMFMPNFCVDELAAHAASLILALNRNTAYYDRHIRAGEWPKAKYFQPRNLKGLTLGLYGFGGSARPLYKIMHDGFGMRVAVCDPFVDGDVRRRYDASFMDFERMLSTSDIISIHAPLNDKTKGIFNSAAFRMMKNDAMLINIARGGLIDEAALIDALHSGEIRFAGLDVFEKEPVDENNPLLKMDNVVLTCHSAFYGDTSQQTQLRLAFELVNKALNARRVDAKYVANKGVVSSKGILIA